MTKYVWNGETFVDTTGWKRRPSVFPAIIRDTQEPLMHPATGQIFDSKSRFREVTKAHGLTEIGNDKQTIHNPRAEFAKSRKADIAQAIEMVEQGYQPPPLEKVSDGDFGDVRMLGS